MSLVVNGELCWLCVWDDQRVTGVGGERAGQYELFVVVGTVSGTDAFRVKTRVMVWGNAVALSHITKQPLATHASGKSGAISHVSGNPHVTGSTQWKLLTPGRQQNKTWYHGSDSNVAWLCCGLLTESRRSSYSYLYSNKTFHPPVYLPRVSKQS